MIPTGYSFNLDGTSIYLTMAAVFIAQATNTPMTLTQQLTLLAGAAADVQGRGRRHRQRLHRAGGHACRRSGHVPVAGLALILGIDRFMSEARALTNLIGNGVATVVVAKWTGDLDTERMQRAPRQRDRRVEADEPEKVLDAGRAHMPRRSAR